MLLVDGFVLCLKIKVFKLENYNVCNLKNVGEYLKCELDDSKFVIRIVNIGLDLKRKVDLFLISFFLFKLKIL